MELKVEKQVQVESNVYTVKFTYTTLPYLDLFIKLKVQWVLHEGSQVNHQTNFGGMLYYRSMKNSAYIIEQSPMGYIVILFFHLQFHDLFSQ